MSEPIEITLLNHLEEIEFKSIQWGYTDGILDEDEVFDFAEKLIEDNDINNLDEDELVQILLDENLLFEVQTVNKETGFRTRFGEAVRLLTNLRQIFPNRNWDEAPRLVSDFRVNLQKRFYPVRDVEPLSLLLTKPFNDFSPLQKLTWKKLLTIHPEMKLARFQADATSILLNNDDIYEGVIVTAGTGSGKTLSFYLPALLKIVNSINMDSEYWTRVLAAYPRVELLRDQLSEALLQSLEIEDTLVTDGKRPIKIGALYGSVPNNCSYQSIEQKKWKRNIEDTGWICPIINCPKTDTPLIWLDSDVKNNIERLVPSKKNIGAITLEPRHIVLTRDTLINEPADILFITLEMLNQRLSDNRYNILFGIGKEKHQKPFLMLLDEVHTYIGTTGAQAALVIRRWKQALWGDVKFVGLSATLDDAERFFSELTGLYKNKVIEVTPNKDDMVEEGAEYQIILKGDPVNRTGILSTTIQTIMLMGRIVEPLGLTSKYYGKKVFAFTDDLDVTNRLFDDLKDAEGWNVFGKNDPDRGSLASLRFKDINDYHRYRDGQDWRISEDIGHILNEHSTDAKLKITRTSSQDTGVDKNCSVVVATASLEVGFNDPTVGVVIQHKSPHNWANFLQRKGRAGRKRNMRPFMITTLSDFGRDKVSFQHYEHYFEPKVPAQRLPIYNRYILKIQGTITLFDWLSKKISKKRVWMFKILSQPSSNDYELNVLKEIKLILDKILDVSSQEYSEFTSYLKYALKISDDNMEQILWSSPRSLLLEVIPILLRRISSNWELAFPTEETVYEHHIPRKPLPEFITTSLFSDLALPEVKVVALLDQDREKSYTMPLMQAMREFSPGRISRRFATERGNLFHWIPISIEDESQNLELKSYCKKYDFVTTLKNENIKVVRPWEYQLEKNTDPRISKRSNSILDWKVNFKQYGLPVNVHLVKGNKWSQTIKNIEFYVNSNNASVETVRYATKSTANFSFTDGTALETVVNFVIDNETVGVGFSMNVDGLHINYCLPSLDELKEQNLPVKLERELKVAWYKCLVSINTELPNSVNQFERNWLQEVILNAIIIVSSDKNIDLIKANDILNNDSSVIFEVLSELFNTDIKLLLEDSEEFESTSESRLYLRLNELLENKEIRIILHSIFNDAISNNDSNWRTWLRNSLHQSFSETILSACQNLTPNQTAIDTLLVDALPVSNDDISGNIWITESSAGGVGVLDELLKVISKNPTLFFQAIDASTQLSDYERVVDSLEYFIYLIHEQEDIRNISLEICSLKEHKLRTKALSRLYDLLSENGISISHAFKVAINTRLLKEGVDNNFFKFVYEMIEWRDTIENDKKIAIDLRLLCFLISKQKIFQQQIDSLLIFQTNQKVNTVNFLTNILWPRDFEARWQVLQSYSPFKQNIFTDPKLVQFFILEDKIQYVNISEYDWKEKVVSALAMNGICKLRSNPTSKTNLRNELVTLLSEPIDIDFLQLFVVIAGIEKERTDTIVSLKLREEW
jgi:Helicase conserved C-terminal domain/DEAD/DEAH box helicase